MEELLPESKAVYDMLKEHLDENLDQRLREQKDTVIGAVKKMFTDQDLQIGDLTKKFDDIRDDLSLDIGQIRLDLECATPKGCWANLLSRPRLRQPRPPLLLRYKLPPSPATTPSKTRTVDIRPSPRMFLHPVEVRENLNPSVPHPVLLLL